MQQLKKINRLLFPLYLLLYQYSTIFMFKPMSNMSLFVFLSNYTICLPPCSWTTPLFSEIKKRLTGRNPNCFYCMLAYFQMIDS